MQIELGKISGPLCLPRIFYGDYFSNRKDVFPKLDFVPKQDFKILNTQRKITTQKKVGSEPC